MNLDNLLEAGAYDSGRVLPLQIDFSNFIHYLGCPRYWYYRNILGLSVPSMGVSENLVMGSAIHAGLEAGFRAIQEDPSNAKKLGMLEEISIEAFYEKWDEKGGNDLDYDKAFPKVPIKAEELLRKYWHHYQLEIAEQEVLGVEMPFSIPLDPSLPLLYGTVDLVTRNNAGLIISEHKTTRSFAQRWLRQWSNSLQVECYAFAGLAYFGSVPAICVDGLLFQKIAAKELFTRVWFKKSRKLIARAVGELAHRMAQLKTDTELLLEQVRAGAEIETAFPRNPNQCFMYRECTYYDICPTDVKPSRWQHKAPVGWTHQHQGVYTQEAMMGDKNNGCQNNGNSIDSNRVLRRSTGGTGAS